ncbi:MAG: ATP-binding protein [Pirellulaceae bacterium]|nr:ATP-binding protein [Pirellulaceae bacterium]
MSSLFVLRGRDQGQRFYLNLPLVRIGRDHENDICVHDSEVSRRHAQILLRNGQFVFQDLGSANGSVINQERATEHVLAHGDHLQLGRTLLLFTSKASRPTIGSIPEVTLTSAKTGTASQIDDAVSQIWRSASAPASFGPQSDSGRDGHLDIMYQTALAVSHTLDIDQLLNRIMELILQWVQADRGCIFLLDPENDQPLAKVARYRFPTLEDREIVISRTILEYVLSTEEGVLTSNAAEDERWDDPDSVMQLGIREAICVPMRGRYGIVGAIYVDTSTKLTDDLTSIKSPDELFGRRFKHDHLQMMIAIGNQSGIAIEDTSFYSGLVRSERLAAIGETIAVMSHHIKNILQGFQGGGYLLEQGIKSQDFPTIQDGWALLQRNQDRIYNLVMDMLSFSKEREPQRESVDLNDLLTDVLSVLTNKAKQFNVVIEWTPIPEPPAMSADYESLHRAVLNIVSNAIDAAREAEQPRVQLHIRTVSEPQPRVEIIVDDSGPGIESDDIEKIFSLFESSKGGRGTGLGLPVSKKIMQEHGGDIEVKSVVGSGAQFTLWVPI